MKIETLTYKQCKSEQSVEANCIIHGDCIKVMKYIADDSIDLILCDLPYGTTQCKWDSIIPFAALWEQYKRIITPNAAIVLFGAEPFSSLLRCSNLEWFKYDWIWDKNSVNGHTNAKLKPLNNYEIISVFSEGTTANCSDNNMLYNPQGVIKINKISSGRMGRATYDVNGHNMRRKSNGEHVQEHTNYPKRIITFARDSTVVHPTQKPVLLLEYLIKTYSNEGATILDNTMGSGSTGVAALKTNRKFIGIEKEKTYYDIAHNRIREIPRRIL